MEKINFLFSKYFTGMSDITVFKYYKMRMHKKLNIDKLPWTTRQNINDQINGYINIAARTFHTFRTMRIWNMKKEMQSNEYMKWKQTTKMLVLLI